MRCIVSIIAFGNDGKVEMVRLQTSDAQTFPVGYAPSESITCFSFWLGADADGVL